MNDRSCTLREMGFAANVMSRLLHHDIINGPCIDCYPDVQALAKRIAGDIEGLRLLIVTKTLSNGSVPTMGSRIRQIRKALKLTQDDMAAKLGVKQASVCRWEKDAAQPDEATIEKIATLAHTTPEAIRYGK